MKFAVAIYAGPTTQAAQTALEFVRATLASGHDIYRLFFFNEGACNGAIVEGPLAATVVPESWTKLITAHQLDAVICVNSAQQRGISIDGKSGLALAQGFVIGGLGQLIDGTLNADRLITFG